MTKTVQVKLPLRKSLVILGAVLALIGFLVAIAGGFTAEMAGQTAKVSGIIMGTPTVTAAGTSMAMAKLMGFECYGANAVLSLVGAILMLVAGLAAVLVALLVKKPWAKWVIIGLAVVILVGAIFVFCIKDSYINSIVAKGIQNGEIEAGAKKEAIETLKEEFADFKVNAGAIISGILGILGAGSVVASQFVPEKK